MLFLHKIDKKLVTFSSVFALSAVLVSPVQAAEPGEEAGVQSKQSASEIVVTARKRDEGIYSVPIAITAISADDLKAANANSLQDIGRTVPSLTATNFGAGNISHASFFIRGIGIQDHIITTDPGVGVYIDGVYLGREMGANLDLANVARVEVLRGPQGTLFGRNTLGGAINIVTIEPGAEEVVRADMKVGTRGRVNASVYGNSSISDTLAFAFSGSVQHRNGIGVYPNVPSATTKVGEIFQMSGRLSVKWSPSDRTSLTFAVDGNDGKYGLAPGRADVINPDGFSGLTQDLVATNDDNNTNDPRVTQTTGSGYGLALTLAQQLNDQLSLKIIGSHRYGKYSGGLDDDFSELNFASFPETGFASQYSGEAQINGEFGKFDFVTGVYYFYEKGQSLTPDYTFFFGDGGYFDINQKTHSMAAYIHGDLALTDKLTLGAGLRYSHDKKDADAYIACCLAPRQYRSDSWSAPTWEGSLTYMFNPLLSVYGSISRGYQSGGYPARPFGGPDTFVAYNPTYAVNYELGFKGKPFPFLRVSAAIFNTDYTDLALQYSQPTEAGFVTLTANAGKARTRGAEFEGTLSPVNWFDLNVNVGYNDAVVTQVDDGVVGVAVGDHPSLTPAWTVAVAPQITIDTAAGGQLTARADYSYRSSMYGQSVNNSYNYIEGRDLVGFDITYTFPDGSLKIGAYGTNIFNKRYDNARLDQYDLGYVEIIRNNDVSEFGIKASKTF